ncbi:serpin-ZX-like [Trifolium pratense]|uniref:serpin-ZX-like n=1 Tax=Trifolium pratense TaxID=57577 RepID=UPI001E690E6C|nr:serpin-ZX-like [Trifolium pratense]
MNFLRKSVGNLTQNSMTITKHLLSKPEFKEKNALISPLSLQTVLSIIAAGTEGPTQRQLLSFLGSESITNLNTLSSQLVSSLLRDASPFGGPSLTFANSIWVEKSLSIYPSFKQMVTTDYMASLESHDFINEADEAAKKVNLWAEKQTKGLIRQVISPPIDSLTRLMFANALYFKGAWDQPFHPSKTKQYDFYLLNDSSVKVPFMTSNKNQFVGAFDGFKVLCLPYERGVDQRQFSMYLFLPDAKDGLLTLIEKMASDSEFLEHNLPNNRVEVGDFRIPKFEISFGLEASDALKELGVVLPFCPSAGVTKMVDTPNSPTWVSDILQKSFIKVNEEGTEAAAVTFSRFFGCARRSSKPVPIDFVADHPFLFMIREDLSGTILFVGQVVDPLAR